VNTIPTASASPDEAMVCARLFSRMVARFMAIRTMPVQITAAGIAAEMATPEYRARYVMAAVKTIPTASPSATDRAVISGTALTTVCLAGLYTLRPNLQSHYHVDRLRGPVGPDPHGQARPCPTHSQDPWSPASRGPPPR